MLISNPGTSDCSSELFERIVKLWITYHCVVH